MQLNSSKRVCEHAAAVNDPPESAAAPPEPVEPRISYVIARLERAVRAQINERLRPHGLTTLQYTTLSVLGSRGQPLSNAQLARRAYMTPQAMIEVLNALEEKGLIRRDPHPNHRRVYPASLTDEGRRVLTVCDASVEVMEEEMLAGLDPAQRERFRRSGSRSVSAPCTRGCRPRVTEVRHQPRRRSLEKNQVA